MSLCTFFSPKHLGVELHVKHDHIAVHVSIGIVFAFFILWDHIFRLGLCLVPLVLLQSRGPFVTAHDSSEDCFPFLHWHFDHGVLLQDWQPRHALESCVAGNKAPSGGLAILPMRRVLDDMEVCIFGVNAANCWPVFTMHCLHVGGLIRLHVELLQPELWLAGLKRFFQVFGDQIVFTWGEDGTICFSQQPRAHVNSHVHACFVCCSLHTVAAHFARWVFSSVKPCIPKEELCRSILQEGRCRQLIQNLLAPIQHETILVEKFVGHAAKLKLLLFCKDILKFFGLFLGDRCRSVRVTLHMGGCGRLRSSPHTICSTLLGVQKVQVRQCGLDKHNAQRRTTTHNTGMFLS